jgi:hypothetical protein
LLREEPARRFGLERKAPAQIPTCDDSVRPLMGRNTQIATRRTRRRQRQADRKITAWLRSHISSIDYGIKTKGLKPHPVHVNRKSTIIEAFNTRNWRRLSRMSNRDFGKHFTGQDTFYFAGNGRSRDPETIALIDIDCHRRGSIQGASAFADYLRLHGYPDLYWEPSTNGNGVHAYVVIEKHGYGDSVVNSALDRLQSVLQDTLASTSFDVEMVEVKGHCPVIGWSERRGEIKKLQMGQLAKIPQEALWRPEELKRTSVLRCCDLLKVPVPEKTQISGRGSGKRPPASISGCFLSEDEVAKTKTSYLRFASLLLHHHDLGTSSKAVVEAMDVSIFLMFLLFFTRHMNGDGSLPWARFRNFWDAVYAAGDIDRPFQPNRFAAIRNYLSSLGLIEWADNTYKIGVMGSDGKKHGGKACKWKSSQILLDLVNTVEGAQAEHEIPEAVAEWGDGERASLSTTSTTEEIKNLTRIPHSRVIRPQQIYDPPPLILLPDDIGKYLTPLEDVWAVAV